MNKPAGFTLIEVLVVIVIFGIVLALGVSSLTNSNLIRSPEDAAREHVVRLYPGVDTTSLGVACKQWDTNGDWNRRCDVRFTHPKTGVEVAEALECDYAGQCAQMRHGYRW